MTIAVGELWTPAKLEVDWTRVALAVLALPATLGVLGAVYGALIYINPIGVFSIFGTLVFGILSGATAAKALALSRVQGWGVAAPVLFLAPLFAHFVGWVVWVFVVLWTRTDLGFFEALFATLWPPSFVEAVGEINRVGVWTFAFRSRSIGDAVHGGLLWAVWVIEAIIVLGTGWVAGFGNHGAAAEGEDAQPVCSACGRQVVTEEDVLRLPVPSAPEQLAARVRALDLSALDAGALPTGLAWCQADLGACPCGATTTLSLWHMQLDSGVKHPSPLLHHLGVSPDHVQQLRAIAARFKSAQAAAFVPTPFQR